jgi:DNA polymerase III epsilon subunit-like protein
LYLFVAVSYFPVRLVGHNISFDIRILRKEFERLGWEDATHGKEILCTQHSSTDLCDIPRRGGGLKAPRLAELYRRLFDCDFEEAHTAMADTQAMMKCFWELRRLGAL